MRRFRVRSSRDREPDGMVHGPGATLEATPRVGARRARTAEVRRRRRRNPQVNGGPPRPARPAALGAVRGPGYDRAPLVPDPSPAHLESVHPPPPHLAPRRAVRRPGPVGRRRPRAAALPYVAIDPGHGGADTGAVGPIPAGTPTGLPPRADAQGRTMLYEKDVNLDIGFRLQAVLNATGHAHADDAHDRHRRRRPRLAVGAGRPEGAHGRRERGRRGPVRLGPQQRPRHHDERHRDLPLLLLERGVAGGRRGGAAADGRLARPAGPRGEERGLLRAAPHASCRRSSPRAPS